MPTRQQALAAAERARAAVAAERLELPGGALLTLSAGICEAAHADQAGDLVRLADGALYWAKANGRDMCIGYTPRVVDDLSPAERIARLERSQALTSIRVLARAVDAKDSTTQRHSERVAELAGHIATALGWTLEDTAALRDAGLVHDVGKIGIPDAILLKPTRLTAEEYAQIKDHAMLGARIVSDVLLPEQVAWVRHHHERWDGRATPTASRRAPSRPGRASSASRTPGTRCAWSAPTRTRAASPTRCASASPTRARSSARTSSGRSSPWRAPARRWLGSWWVAGPPGRGALGVGEDGVARRSGAVTPTGVA